MTNADIIRHMIFPVNMPPDFDAQRPLYTEVTPDAWVREPGNSETGRQELLSFSGVGRISTALQENLGAQETRVVIREVEDVQYVYSVLRVGELRVVEEGAIQDRVLYAVVSGSVGNRYCPPAFHAPAFPQSALLDTSSSLSDELCFSSNRAFVSFILIDPNVPVMLNVPDTNLGEYTGLRPARRKLYLDTEGHYVEVEGSKIPYYQNEPCSGVTLAILNNEGLGITMDEQLAAHGGLPVSNLKFTRHIIEDINFSVFVTSEGIEESVVLEVTGDSGDTEQLVFTMEDFVYYFFGFPMHIDGVLDFIDKIKRGYIREVFLIHYRYDSHDYTSRGNPVLLVVNPDSNTSFYGSNNTPTTTFLLTDGFWRHPSYYPSYRFRDF